VRGQVSFDPGGTRAAENTGTQQNSIHTSEGNQNMIDEKISRVKVLIQKREEIDAELSTIFGISDQPKRGRPKKESTPGEGSTTGPNIPRPSEPNESLTP
jgi:hypothetical protein